MVIYSVEITKMVQYRMKIRHFRRLASLAILYESYYVESNMRAFAVRAAKHRQARLSRACAQPGWYDTSSLVVLNN